MRHQVLIELESMVKQMLAYMTNSQYAAGYKISYKYTWEKGTKVIDAGDGKPIKNYYVLNFIMVDKRESPVGINIELCTTFYPIEVGVPVEKLEEQALKELILNGLQSLANVTYAAYEYQKSKEYTEAKNVELDEKIEALRESAKKPNLYVP